MRRYPEIFQTRRISFKRKIPDSKARFQIPFGIPKDLHKIPAGVGPLVANSPSHLKGKEIGFYKNKGLQKKRQLGKVKVS